MDIFSMFGNPAQLPKKPKGVREGTSATKGGTTKLPGLVVNVHDKSLLFFDDGSGREAFVPLSKIMDWWFTASGVKRGLRVCDLELNDEVTILIPTWLARKEKLG